MNLRKLAKGRDCQIRIPGECLRSTETVVLCHYRMSGLSGFGFKSPDWCGAYGCERCHDIVDGRRGSWIAFPLELRKLFLAEGVIRTLTLLSEEGLLHVGKIQGVVALPEDEAPLPRILPRRPANDGGPDLSRVAAKPAADSGEVEGR